MIRILMRNYFLILIVSAFLFNCKSIEYRNNWDLDFRPRVKPKTLEILTYSYNLETDSIVKTKLTGKEIYHYNKNRQIISHEIFDENGKLMPYSKEYLYHCGNQVQEIVHGNNNFLKIVKDNTFNKKGQIITCIAKKGGIVSSTSTFLYGKSNNSITKITEYSNKEINKEVYNYDSKKRLIKHQFFDENGNFHDGIDYSYNDRQNSSEEKWFNSNNEMIFNIRKKHNKYGDVISHEEMKGKYTIETYLLNCIFIYDQKKNIVKAILTKNGKPYTLTEYNYIYY